MNENRLDECGCYEEIDKNTPIEIKNPPGRTSLKYRIGTHRSFKATMIRSMVNYPSLQCLTTRENDDLSIALLDAWAMISDVITFYQERIANEGFLRTATERKSVLELARSVGYELRQGVAASTFLAFSVEPAAVESSTIRTGTKVQSLPAEGQTAQTFETIEEIHACAEWNDLRPRQKCHQTITDTTTRFYFKGTKTQLKAGDKLLVIQEQGTSPPKFRTVTKVDEQSESELTIVDTYGHSLANTVEISTEMMKNKLNVSILPSTMSPGKLAAELASKKWSSSDLRVISTKYNVPSKDLLSMVNNLDPKSVSNDNIQIFTFRIRAAVFGNNAPRYDSLTDKARLAYCIDTGGQVINGQPIGGEDVGALSIKQINQDLIYLDNIYPSIQPSSNKGTGEDSWLMLTTMDGNDNLELAFRITATREETIAKFLLTGKVTGISFDRNREDMSKFKIRSTNVFVKSEKLDLSEIQIQEPVCGNVVTLDHAVNFQLGTGQIISITGDILDEKGIPLKVRKSEIATISSTENDGMFTKIILAKKLEYNYKRDTVVINANLVRATHGESRFEVLGSGNPSMGQKEFILKGKPLTYVHDPSLTGSKSTLEVIVNETIWEEVRSLFSSTSKDNVYTTRLDEDGQVRVIFGDGSRGARPDAGTENIKAKYRVGTGMTGLLNEGQLNLLVNRPMGVRTVTNPLSPKGAADPESLNDARDHASLTLLAMNRIVSLSDFENFAIAFAGIGKGKAALSWEGEYRVVHLTIASADGEIVDEPLSQNLQMAINKFKDPSIKVKVQAFIKVLFNIKAKVAIGEGRKTEEVIVAIKTALAEAYSFKSSNFQQPVTSSQVIAFIQGVDGVAAVDLDYLHIHGEEQNFNVTIPTLGSRILETTHDSGGLSKWLLLLNPDGVELEVMSL